MLAFMLSLAMAILNGQTHIVPNEYLGRDIEWAIEWPSSPADYNRNPTEEDSNYVILYRDGTYEFGP